MNLKLIIIAQPIVFFQLIDKIGFGWTVRVM